MQYRLIEESSIKALEEMVNLLLANGWEPYGDPIITMTDDGQSWYAQALIQLPEPTDADEE